MIKFLHVQKFIHWEFVLLFDKKSIKSTAQLIFLHYDIKGNNFFLELRWTYEYSYVYNKVNLPTTSKVRHVYVFSKNSRRIKKYLTLCRVFSGQCNNFRERIFPTHRRLTAELTHTKEGFFFLNSEILIQRNGSCFTWNSELAFGLKSTLFPGKATESSSAKVLREDAFSF